MQLLNPLTVYRGDLRYLRFLQDVDCLATDSVGDTVYVTGDIVGGNWQVEKADHTDANKMPAVGVLVSKASATVGVVQTFGPITGIYSGLTAGAIYYVTSAGLDLVVPTVGEIQALGVASSSGEFFLPGSIGGVGGGVEFDGDVILVERTTGLVMIERTTGNVLVTRP